MFGAFTQNEVVMPISTDPNLLAPDGSPIGKYLGSAGVGVGDLFFRYDCPILVAFDRSLKRFIVIRVNVDDDGNSPDELLLYSNRSGWTTTQSIRLTRTLTQVACGPNRQSMEGFFLLMKNDSVDVYSV